MTYRQPLTVAVIGAAVSANKGAASMFYGLIDGLREQVDCIDVALLTTYPEADRETLASESLPKGVSVTVTDASPKSLVLAFILALPIRILDRMGISLGPLGTNLLIRRIRESDVVVDLAGISFADGRGMLLLIYNAVMSLTPYFSGGTVVKASQALGPMKSLPVRLGARFTLPRMKHVCARGAVTRSHLDALHLRNVVNAADIAFLMRQAPGPGSPASWPVGSGARILVFPSSVVDSYADRLGIDHIAVLTEVIESLANQGHSVMVVPHSFRTNGERSRMNDGPIVGDLEATCRSESVSFMNSDVDPRQLRRLAQEADLVVTGRFHGMVSALEVGTVPVVIGWSHKYGEVLDQFDVTNVGIAVEDLDSATLSGMIDHCLAEKSTLEGRIAQSRSKVIDSSRNNIDIVLSTAASSI